MQPDDIRQLSAWLEATDIDMMELQGPGTRLCLRRNGTSMAIAPQIAEETAGPSTVVEAACVGVFLHEHPLRGEPLAASGTQVRAGQVVGLLQVGALLLPVTAPQDGTVESMLVAQGTAVGWGTPLVELLPL